MSGVGTGSSDGGEGEVSGSSGVEVGEDASEEQASSDDTLTENTLTSDDEHSPVSF